MSGSIGQCSVRTAAGVHPVFSIISAIFMVALMAAVASADITLDLALGREKVYQGEAVPVTVTLRVNGETVRNIGYPRLSTPGGGSVGFSSPVQIADPGDSGATLYHFQGRIEADKPGSIRIGPARLDCEVMEIAGGSAAYYGGVDSQQRSVASTPAALTVMALPVSGRPVTFSGAVGTFRMKVRTRPDIVRANDPLTIVTTLSGSGNLAEIRCPLVEGAELHSYPLKFERRRESLVCEQVVIPKTVGKLPPVAWSYFDSQLGSYQTLQQELPGVLASGQPSTVPVTINEKPSQAIPVLPVSGGHRVPAGLIAVFALLVAAPVWFYCRRKRQYMHPDRSSSDTSIREQYLVLAEKALRENDVENFYTLLFMILQEVVAEHCNLTHDSISGMPPSAALPDQYNLLICKLFYSCDGVRYGRVEASRRDMEDDFSQLHVLLRNVPKSFRKSL